MSEPEGIIDYIYGLVKQIRQLQFHVNALSQTVDKMQQTECHLPATDEQLDLIAHKVEVALALKLIDRAQQGDKQS